MLNGDATESAIELCIYIIEELRKIHLLAIHLKLFQKRTNLYKAN